METYKTDDERMVKESFYNLFLEQASVAQVHKLLDFADGATHAELGLLVHEALIRAKANMR